MEDCSIAEAAGSGRLLIPSSNRWSSIELVDSNYTHVEAYSFVNSRSYSKSINFHLSITDRHHFQRCVIASVFAVIAAIILIVLLLTLLSHTTHHHTSSEHQLSVAVNHALLFFDAQKSGHYPRENGIKFRGDSGLHDGKTKADLDLDIDIDIDLVGGFYDSGNNMKFSFPTAYMVTLLSWSVIEYHDKYSDINELDHIKDIISWGSNYLLKIFVQSNTTTAILYSQVGTGTGTPGNSKDQYNDMSCWQRPEDMSYPRPVSICDTTASDLAGEIVAGMSAASLVFKGADKHFSEELVQAAEKLFNLALKVNPLNRRTYTSIDDCGGRARQFYNSSGYNDELIWGATWLFFATGNNTYLDYATKNYAAAAEEEKIGDDDVFSWDNKLSAIAILLTRLRYFRDLGYPYETAFRSATNRTDMLMCSYTSSKKKIPSTKGGLILLKPDSSGGAIQYAAIASFLTKLYSDYLEILPTTGINCANVIHSLENLKSFASSQVEYILGDNPMRLSYLVGYGDHYPTHVHHRAASIPWDGKRHNCGEGDYWLNTKDPNPNTLLGAMVAGPDNNDKFVDDRAKKWFTEPSIWGNAGLTAALIALHHPPTRISAVDGDNSSLDKNGLFVNLQIVP